MTPTPRIVAHPVARLRNSPLLRIIALLPLLAACGDALGPEEFAGTYALVSVGGTALPLRSVAAGDTQYVLSERLEVFANARARIARFVEFRRANGAVDAHTFESDFATRVEGDALVLQSLCGGPNELCAEPSVYFLYREPDGGVRIEQRGFTGPSRYVKLTPVYETIYLRSY